MWGSREQWGVHFYIGEIKSFAFFKLENFQIMLENQCTFYNFLKILRKCCDFLHIFSNFIEIFAKILENFGNMDLEGGSGKLAKILKN